MPIASRRAVLGAFAASSAAVLARPARARETSVADGVDALARAVMSAFPDQPGMAVAVVEDGVTTLARGYGVLRAGEAAPVTERSLFAIASNTKAYTAAALAILVDEGRLEWDAPVARYMPDFAMSDPAVTAMLSVRDLLCHRSGLALGAGDLMMFPETTHTRSELVAGLRHLPLARGFRARYAYDNVLYIVAGELILAVTGRTWEDFVQARLLDPLGMGDSTTSFDRPPAGAEVAWPHARLGPPVRGMGPMARVAKHTDLKVAAAAGGIYASARDMAKWVAAQLKVGVAADGARLWSEDSARAMWTPEVIIGSARADPDAGRPDRAFVTAYALGWYVENFRDRRLVWHSGGIDGFATMTLLLPGLNKGLVVLTNAEEGGVLRSMRNGGLDRLMGRQDYDWLAYARRVEAAIAEQNAGAVAATVEAPANAAPPGLPLSAYAGVYRDPWYGTVTVRERAGGLHVTFDKTPAFDGPLEPFDGETFRTRWNRPGIEDAFLTFAIEGGRAVSATAQAVSPAADFSYDFHDLRLTREP